MQNHVLGLNMVANAWQLPALVQRDRIERIRSMEFVENATMVSVPASGERVLTLDYLALFFPLFSRNSFWHIDGGGVESVRNNGTHFFADWWVKFGGVSIPNWIPRTRFRAVAEFEQGTKNISFIRYDQVAGFSGLLQLLVSKPEFDQECSHYASQCLYPFVTKQSVPTVVPFHTRQKECAKDT